MPYDKRYFLLFLLLLLLSLLMSQLFPKRADIIIFSPHPDDAVLCCAGLIQQSRDLGKTVQVVDITDGDGYLESAAALSGKSEESLTPQDMLRLGRTRKREEIRAMRLLGLSPGNITFLGYPDGWLEETRRAEITPFFNPYTQTSYTTNGRPFLNTAVISDISRIITHLAPSEIYVTDTHDAILDHKVAYNLVTDAASASGYTGTIHTYVIHTQDDVVLAGNTRTLLTKRQIEAKQRAIESYTSQLLVEGDYLRWFVKDEEVFY